MRVVDNATVRRIDERCIAAGTPGRQLMERAGEGAARELSRRLGGFAGTTLVLSGRGNNGGDGLVLARHLHVAGQPVVVLQLTGELSTDAQFQLEATSRLGIPIFDATAENLGSCLRDYPGRWLVDAVLGSGFRPPLRPPLDSLMRVVRESGRRVFALDVPSGLNGDTGECDEQTPVAGHTVFFGLPRVGLLRGDGRLHAGRLHRVDPGFDQRIVEEECAALTGAPLWVDAERVARSWPRRAIDAHKYRAGSLLVIGGSRGMSGATALVCQAAHRTGAGLVEALVPAPVASVVDSASVETIVRGMAATDRGGLSADLLEGILERAAVRSAAVLGPGAGDDPETARLLVQLCAELALPCVVDADALNAFSRDGSRPTFPSNCVVTPHAGELDRLPGGQAADAGSDRFDRVREAASRLGCVVLLKGAPTLVADPGGRMAVIGAGGPELATAGSGDVLAGSCGALLAAGLDPFDAACSAAFVHGRAGEELSDEYGTLGVVAGDLPAAIARVGRRMEAIA